MEAAICVGGLRWEISFRAHSHNCHIKSDTGLLPVTDVENNMSTPLGRHFAHCGMGSGSMVVQIIDGVIETREDSEEALRCLEGVWQLRLAVFKQHRKINHRDEMEVTRRQPQPVPAFLRGVLGI